MVCAEITGTNASSAYGRDGRTYGDALSMALFIFSFLSWALKMNRNQTTIDWRFTRIKAYAKLGHKRNHTTRSETEKLLDSICGCSPCGCSPSEEPGRQLLADQWWPSSGCCADR